MSVSMEVASPPSSSPSSVTGSKRRAGEDENASVAPKPKKRLLGRVLGAELTEVENNAVSNALTTTAKLGSFSSATEKTQPPKSLPTPPAERAIDLELSTPESDQYDYSLSTNGSRVYLASRAQVERLSYERLIAQRSETAGAGKPQKEFYGINIHELMEQAEKAREVTRPEEVPRPQVLPSVEGEKSRRRAGLMWTEKYRAKKFLDLCGDERTHRQVMRWLKSWDQIVFPGIAKPKSRFRDGATDQEEYHRKILLLTGPPGLGKTTLAHVCAKQAGYECVEVNASDERSSNVVRNRIRDCLGTENVRGVNIKTEGGNASRKPGKPVCVVLDEVDGVTAGGGGSSDGGFMKALVDLVMLDQKNSKPGVSGPPSQRGKKGDKFRLLRPLILVCNDVYAPALRPLRAAGIAEIIHVRKPPIEKVIERVQSIFDKEGVPSDKDAVRRLCEHTWGISGRREAKVGRSSADGDMRSVLVVAEWAAAKLRATSITPGTRLTRQWIDNHIIQGSLDNHVKGLGRGGAREVADRVFMENAGFAKKARNVAHNPPQFRVPGQQRQVVTDTSRFESIRMLRECIDTTDDHDRVMTEIFTSYPTYTFQDDMILTKPNTAYEWLHFHDRISSKVYSEQEWELKPYQSTPTLGFHYLFGNSTRGAAKTEVDRKTATQEDPTAEPSPFSGPRAAFDAHEFHKETRAVLSGMQACEDFNINLKRMFHSAEELAVDLLPQLIRMLTPEVKPVVVGGGKGEKVASVRRESEREMVRRSVQAMGATGVTFEKYRIEDPRAGNGGYIYRMEPALDTVAMYESLSGAATTSSARYAVRQIMEQEHRKFVTEEQANARKARWRSGATEDELAEESGGKEPNNEVAIAASEEKAKVKKDFFGRIIQTPVAPTKAAGNRPAPQEESGKVKIWATFNEGFSNAVKKPISMKELLDGL